MLEIGSLEPIDREAAKRSNKMPRPPKRPAGNEKAAYDGPSAAFVVDEKWNAYMPDGTVLSAEQLGPVDLKGIKRPPKVPGQDRIDLTPDLVSQTTRIALLHLFLESNRAGA